MTIKQVVVVRTDLDMGKGKIAAQVGHACVLGAEHVRKSNPEWFSEWWTGQEKIVLKIKKPWYGIADAGNDFQQKLIRSLS